MLAGAGLGAGCSDAREPVRWWLADRDGCALIGLDPELAIVAELAASWPVAIQVLDGVPWVEECMAPGPRTPRRYRPLLVDGDGVRGWRLGAALDDPPPAWRAEAAGAELPGWMSALSQAHPRLDRPIAAVAAESGDRLLLWHGGVLLARPGADHWRFGPSQGGFEALVGAAAVNAAGTGPLR